MWSRSTNASDKRFKNPSEYIDEGRDEVEADPRRNECIKSDETLMSNNLSPEKIILKRKPSSLSKISRSENVELNRRYKLQSNNSEDDNIKFVNVQSINELNRKNSNTEYSHMQSPMNSEKYLSDSHGTNYQIADLKKNLEINDGNFCVNVPTLEKVLAQKTKALEQLESRIRHISLEFDQKRHHDAVEIENLKQENSTIQKTLSERNKEYERTSFDLSESKKTLKNLETELSNMKVAVKEAEAKATSSESLQTRLEESESFVTILQKDKEQSMQRSHSTIEMLRQKNRELEEMQSSLKSKTDNLEKELGEQKKEIENDKIKHKKEMQSSAIEGKKLRDENYKQMSLISKFQREQEKYEASMRDLQNKVNEKDNEICQRDEKLNRMYEQSHMNLEEEREKARLLNQQVLQLKDEVTKRDARISIAVDEKNNNANVIRSLKSDLESVNKDGESLKEEVQSLKQQIVEIESLQRIERNKSEEKISVIENLKKSLTRKENFIVSLQSELSELASCFQEHFNKDQLIRTLKREFETQKQTCADLHDQLEIEKKRKENDALHPYQSRDFGLDLRSDDGAKVFVGAIEFERLKEKEERLRVTEKELADIKENIKGKLLMNEAAVETLRERERKVSKSEKKLKSFQDSTIRMVFLNEHEVQTYQGFEMMWRKTKQELEGLKESMKGKVLVNNQDLKEWTVELSNARSIVEKYGSLEDYGKKFHSLETAIVEKDELIRTLEEEMNYLEKIKIEEIKKKDSDISSLRKSLSDVESKLASNEINSAQVITDFEERLIVATKENDNIKQDLLSLEDRERKLIQDLDTLRKRESEVSSSLEITRDEKHRLQNEINSLKKSISITDGKIADAMSSIEKENNDLKRQISKINDEKTMLNDQNNEMKAKLKDSQDSIEEVNSSMQNLNSMFCALQLERDDLEISKEKLTVQISKKEYEIKEVRMELNKLIELEQEVENLKKQNASQKHNYEQKLNESSDEIEAATCEREAALKHLCDLRKEHFSLQNELTAVRLDLAENEAKDKRIESLEKICSKLRHDISDMRENQDDIVHNLDGNLYDVTQRNNDLMNQLNNLKKTNTELEQEMNELKTSYTEKCEQDIIKSQKNVKELNKMKEENLALVELMKTKVADYEELKKEYDSIKKTPSTKSDLEQRISVADERIRTLEDLVRSLTKEKDRYAENIFKTELKFREATKRQHQLEKRMKAQSKLLSKAESVMAETNAATLNTVMAALDKTNI